MSLFLNCLSEEEQFDLYSLLKMKYETGSFSLKYESRQYCGISKNTSVYLNIFSRRLKGIFADHHVSTFEDLCKFKRSEIRQWRNVGEKAITEIEDALSALGMVLAG